MAKKSKVNVLKVIGKILWFIIKIPYYLIKGIIYLISILMFKVKEENIRVKRAGINPIYEEFKLLNKEKGDYKNFINSLYNSENKIGIIIGARGTGKTALGVKILENLYSKKKKNIYAMGFDEKEMPSWINMISDISELENNSFVLIDEGGVYFNSRKAMSNANELLSELILISRHKNLTILFISQNSSNLDVNILRQSDFLLLKPSSLLQKDFERKIIQKIYDSTEDKFNKYSKTKGITYVYSNEFRGFISNSLPSFWKSSISK